jgi:galactonate dehydratase
MAKSLDVPVHRLLGRQVRERALLGWWACDQAAEDWVRECKEASVQGYTSFKAKARPWFDLDKQCQALEKILPGHFEVDFDFNSFLLDVTHAGRRLPQWERYHHLALHEAPIPQEDVAGNKLLRARCRLPLAMHFGSPPAMTALREEVCDAFVIGGRVSRILRDATLAATADKPFWLQLVGTSLTAVFGLHLAAVLSHARWPAVHCHHVYTQGLLRTGITVTNGMAVIPSAPGLGVELDEDVIAQHRIPKLQRTKVAPMLFAIRWPTGGTSYYAHESRYAADFLQGRLPVFPPGTNFEEIADDGSREWKEIVPESGCGGAW